MATQAPLPHQLLFHHDLRGNTSVITARVPQGGLASHPVPGGKDAKQMSETSAISNQLQGSACTYHLVRVSWMELVRAWPKWSDPVTLGGGMQIMNMPRGFGSLILFLCQESWGRRMGYCGRDSDKTPEWETKHTESLSYPVFWLKESLLLPPWIPRSFHILWAVGVRKRAKDIWRQVIKKKKTSRQCWWVEWNKNKCSEVFSIYRHKQLRPILMESVKH